MAIRISFFLYLLVVTQSACGDADMKDYRRLVSKEMATGKRVVIAKNNEEVEIIQ
jgi:hypothetical protein